MLKKLLNDKDEVYQFAVAASGPREGQLLLDKKVKLKKKEVQQAAEAEAKKNAGKPVKLDVMTGECRLDGTNVTTLRLLVNGKAPAKAVACMDHLLVRGPFKAIGFTGVILEEVAEVPDEEPAAPSPDDDAPTAKDSDEQAAWKKALAAVEPDYDKGLRNRPDVASKLRAVMDFAKAKAEGKDFAAAIAGVQKVADLLRTASTTPAPSGGEVKAKSTAPDSDEPRFKARVTAIKLQFDQIKAADPARARPLAGLLMQAISLGQDKQFADAMLRLDKIEELMKGASSAKPTEPPVEDEPQVATPTPTPESIKELQDRLKALLVRQKAIFEKAPDERKTLLPFTLPATSLAPTGKPGAAEALDKLEEAIAGIEARLAPPKQVADPTETPETPESTKEQEPVVEPSSAPTWDDRLAEAEAAFDRLKPDNPFGAELRSRLKFLQDNRPQEDDARGWEIAQQNLSVLQERAAEALPFDKQLGLVQALLKKVQGDPRLGNLATELMERVQGVVNFARQSMPDLGPRISQSMAELATLEGKARSGLPADVVRNLDELLALQARADQIWNRIETVGDDDVRDELSDQYRQLTEMIPSEDEVSSDRLAEVAELLATLEQKVQDALAAAPSTKAEPNSEEPNKAEPNAEEPTDDSTDDEQDDEQDDDSSELEQLMADLEPKLLSALRADPDARNSLEALWNFATEQVESGDDEKARKSIERLQAALDAALAKQGEAAEPASSSADDSKDEAGRQRRSTVQLQQSRLIWESTLRQVRAERDQLIRAIQAEFDDPEDQTMASEATQAIRSSLDEFNEQLLETLDLALNAEKPEDRAARNAEAAKLIQGYLAHVQDEPIFAELDDNPFLPVKLQQTLVKALTDLSGKLA